MSHFNLQNLSLNSTLACIKQVQNYVEKVLPWLINNNSSQGIDTFTCMRITRREKQYILVKPKKKVISLLCYYFIGLCVFTSPFSGIQSKSFQGTLLAQCFSHVNIPEKERSTIFLNLNSVKNKIQNANHYIHHCAS